MSGWKLLHILTPDWWACSASLSQPCHIFIGPDTLWWWELYFQLFFLPRKIILLEKKILMDSSSGLCLLPPHGLIWFCLPFSFYFFFFFNAEKLADRKLNVAEVTQSEIGQKQKLQTVLEAVHDLLRPHGWTIKWNVDCKDSYCVLYLNVCVCYHLGSLLRALSSSAGKSKWLGLPVCDQRGFGFVRLKGRDESRLCSLWSYTVDLTNSGWKRCVDQNHFSLPFFPPRAIRSK